RESRLGKPLPLLAAVLVPVLGLGLYLHYGAIDKVELTREFAQPPVSLADMTQRLEKDDYEEQLITEQARLSGLMRDKRMRKHALVTVFEGNDAAGK
ncbi:hypothetical protein KSI36_24225, partial [Salmonella enterica subsp. enterica serovar Indiana]|nr:hypothetical protein [Salmonella enterica subsp. enterica serovar Indiana]